MRKLASSPWPWVALAGTVLLGHLWWAWTSNAGQPVARAGAVVIVLGVMVIARPIVRLGYGEWLAGSKIIDGGHVVPTTKEIEAERQADLDALCVQRIGPTMVFIGTLINGYGDLLAAWVLRLG